VSAVTGEAAWDACHCASSWRCGTWRRSSSLKFRVVSELGANQNHVPGRLFIHAFLRGVRHGYKVGGSIWALKAGSITWWSLLNW
jgi:hypothetical protein